MHKLIRTMTWVVSLIIFVACQSAPAPNSIPVLAKTPLSSGVMIVRNGTVIDGTGGPPIPEGLLALKDGKITAVGPSDHFQVPEDAVMLDAHGGTILPGFIDAHTHILRDGSTSNLTQWLRAGVTTLRDLGSEYGTDELPSHDIIALKEHLAEAGNTIPTVVVTGPILTARDGYPVPTGGRRIALEVSDVEEARHAATRLLASGADGLKIAVQRGTALRRLPTLTSEQVAAITQVARAHHTWVSAHIIDPEDAARVVANGVDDLAHAPVVKMPDELIRQMVARDVLLIPTLVAEGGFRANLSYTDREDTVALDATRYNLRRFLAAGGRVALGSDFGTGRMPLGMPLLELQSMVNVGMTPMQVIAAATQHAAQACGLQDRLGTLEVGKQADVIVVKGAPLKDIQAMKDVMIVIKGGEVIVQP